MPLHPNSLLGVTPLSLLQQRLQRGRCDGSASSWLHRRLPLQRRCEARGEVQRRSFASRDMQLSRYSPPPSSSSSSLLSTVMQAKDVVTRLGPSERFPGLCGVFLTKPIKKFHPIEVLPTAASAAATTTTAATADSSAERPDASRSPTSAIVSQAPPFVLNLAFAPRHSISLRRFLALRHMFSTSAYLHVATEDGWYLVAPSSAAPLCPDVTGLQAWCCRHHHRYLKHAATAVTAATSSSTPSSRAPRCSTHTGIAKLEAALDNGEELSEEQLQRLAAQEKAFFAHTPENEEADIDDDTDETDDMPAVREPRHPLSQKTAAPTAETLRKRSAGAPASAFGLSPPLIPEAHLFDINDGVAWLLPPSDDLANHEYWKSHRQRMALYESTGDADAAEQREALLATLRADPAIAQHLSSEQELYAAAEALFQALKHKANVTLNVDADTGLLTLVPLRDLHAGEELLLHYGREWWTGRLLFSLLLSVSDAEMPQIRWIEQLFDHAVDRSEPFPLLIVAHEQRKRPRRGCSGGAKVRKGLKNESSGDGDEQQQQSTQCASLTKPHGDSAETSSTTAMTAELPVSQRKLGRAVLYNTVTHKRATDAAVLAFAVRRSCIEPCFLSRLLAGDAAGGVEPVFYLSEPDKEVPMRVLRRVLLASLRGTTASAQRSIPHKDESASVVAGSAVADTAAAVVDQGAPPQTSTNTGGDGDDGDDAVFSV
ncbi:conserved hypothetical protein [Leishmania major strain Friedlin]|uniref:SET domain-containing protein n=1 Tax=Leishmania major TaxID=5664 RepID=Q4QC99_LEIMA|nr:conserved hypothetical protein [Leishmania major strain Friedlin]CAG9573462.1 hypothetical_protein_-_conserved [Leishmania major strain Friedlin]CAJ04462.1 conserved hypothetical protein [Leishmania major strain Friedlin]|eukprot:XP_001683049.1 conserved hypothetical protein [Leishmania major strain Friedlin]